jgi:molybdopterin molybdotransferase
MTQPSPEHGHTHPRADMLSVEEARARILGFVRQLSEEERPLLQALGQTLAEEVTSSLDIPPWANAGMDGYALRHDDIAGAAPDRPVMLRVIDTVAAGRMPSRAVERGTAIRIMTGAPLPPGADTVAPFEETDESARKRSGKGLDEIGVGVTQPRGANVRPAGEDVRRGEVVLQRGAVLTPPAIGVAASVGRTRVRVVRRPVVAVLSTGDELQEPGSELAPGKIYDANSMSVAASVLQVGGIPKVLGIARDNLEDMHVKISQGLEADLLLTSAGVSRGDYDLVKDVLAQRGAIEFWSVRMRPAKPLAFGLLRKPDGSTVPHIGLPGNPVSALVAFEQLVRPALLRMLGRTAMERPVLEAVLDDDVRNADGRRVYARVVVSKRNGTYHARLAGPQGSNVLTTLARANGLAICPEDVPVMRAGERVQVQMFTWPEEVTL